MQTGDAGDFIEFGTLAVEIKSLCLVSQRVSLSLYEQDVHGIISMREEEEEVRKKKRVPFVVMVGVAYIECATSTSLKLHK